MLIVLLSVFTLSVFIGDHGCWIRMNVLLGRMAYTQLMALSPRDMNHMQWRSYRSLSGPFCIKYYIYIGMIHLHLCSSQPC